MVLSAIYIISYTVMYIYNSLCVNIMYYVSYLNQYYVILYKNINISSSAGNKIYPGGAVYCATKAAVKMFTEGLRMELAPNFGIKATSIEPGAVDTELTDTITDEEIKKDFVSSLQELTPLESEDIAEAIYYALSQPGRANINEVYVMPTQQQQ